jgi:hypothetical protein
VDEILLSYADNASASEFVAIRSCSAGLSLPRDDSSSIQLVMDAVAEPNSVWQDGWLHYYSRIWVGADEAVHSNLVSAVEIHDGAPILYRRINQIVVWEVMKAAVSDF